MEADCAGCRELSRQRDDYKYDADGLRAKLEIVEKELQARLERTPRARSFLSTLLQVVRG